MAQKIAARFQYLGIRDTARKRRPPAKEPVGWARAVFAILLGQIYITVTQEKWDKGRAIIASWIFKCEDLKTGQLSLNHKELEKQCGFLVHLAMTFPNIMLFLKEVYVTMNSWHPNRGENGWQLLDQDWRDYLDSLLEEAIMCEEEKVNLQDSRDAPKTVDTSRGFESSAQALKKLFEPVTVPKILFRSQSTVHVVHGFGDALGLGFGSGTVKVH